MTFPHFCLFKTQEGLAFQKGRFTFRRTENLSRRACDIAQKEIMKSYPSKLYVETTTRCNLRCSMCVKQTQGACIPETDMDMDVFRAMAPAFPHLDGLILNGIGEPLLSRNLTEMIKTARQVMRPDAEIGFQSNGLLLTRNRARQLVDAGLDTICLSVDTVTGDSISHGGEDVGRVASAFAYLREASEASGRPLRIGVEFVLMRETAEALPRSLAWAAEQGAQFALVTHVLPYTEAVVDQDLFNPNTDASMAEFARWRKEADARGLDLSKYYGLPWKFHKTDEESRLVRFVVKRQKPRLPAISRYTSTAFWNGLLPNVRPIANWLPASLPRPAESVMSMVLNSPCRLLRRSTSAIASLWNKALRMSPRPAMSAPAIFSGTSIPASWTGM